MVRCKGCLFGEQGVTHQFHHKRDGRSVRPQPRTRPLHRVPCSAQRCYLPVLGPRCVPETGPQPCRPAAKCKHDTNMTTAYGRNKKATYFRVKQWVGCTLPVLGHTWTDRAKKIGSYSNKATTPDPRPFRKVCALPPGAACPMKPDDALGSRSVLFRGVLISPNFP